MRKSKRKSLAKAKRQKSLGENLIRLEVIMSRALRDFIKTKDIRFVRLAIDAAQSKTELLSDRI